MAFQALLSLAFITQFVLQAQHCSTQVVNVVKKPIKNGKLTAHVRFFAQIPEQNSKSAKILCIAPFQNDLYVVSSLAGTIYRVSAQGKVSKWFNVAQAVQKATGRKMFLEDVVHGGLRSVAIHPSFAKTGLFYTSMVETRPKDESKMKYFSKPTSDLRATGDSVVIEWRYNHAKKQVNPGSYRQVIRVGLPRPDHAVKQMVFAENNLMIMHGDGSWFSKKDGGGQANDGLGKVIRINPLRSGKKPYTVPKSNPYVGNPKFKDELYAIGFRNPHNVCYSAKSGLYVADVGRDNIEEINIVKAGRDYGWSKREGTFVSLTKAGTGSGDNFGVAKLPKDDAKYGYTYPNVMIGHQAKLRTQSNGLAVAGACPVENGSKLNGIYLYANFPSDGALFYSFIGDMKNAVVRGPPNKLTQATTYRAKVLYDHDGKGGTPMLKMKNLMDIVRMDTGKPGLERIDLRFGRGTKGEIYWSSKSNGRIYLITNTVAPKKK